MRTISARTANQQFSKLLAAAASGEEIVITRRGAPVAKIVPATTRDTSRERRIRIKRMVEMMRRGVHLGGIRVRREDIYVR